MDSIGGNKSMYRIEKAQNMWYNIINCNDNSD